MVDVPGFVRDHEVVAALLDGVLEDHEVLDQHLIHAADRLKAVQLVLAAFELDMPRLAGKPRAQRMDVFVAGFEQACDGVLRQPVDFQVGMELSQLARDGDVAAAMAEADRRREIERALLACRAWQRRPRGRRDAQPAIEKVVDQGVRLCRIAAREGYDRRLRS